MTKVNRHRTYGMTPEWRIIANVLIEPRRALWADYGKPEGE
jgi:hypothetical protein